VTRAHRHTDTCQTFRFIAHAWCVSHVLERVAADPYAARLVPDLDVTSLRQFLPLQPARPGHVKLIEVRVDTGYAATVDLTQPIIVSPILHRSGEHFGFIAVDGWHRIYRALTEGATRLPGYVLSDATANAVRLPWP
jgi:hypothetical protein